MKLSVLKSFRIILIIQVMLLLSATLNAQTIRYVNQAATGAGYGSSWVNAFNTVQAGLNASASGDQVWVAAVKDDAYYERITLKEDVALYGGFTGNETFPVNFDAAAGYYMVEITMDGYRKVKRIAVE